MAALLHLVRALCLCAAAFGVALAVCWKWFPEVLDRHHAEAVSDYRGQYEEARADIRGLAKESPKEALGKALALSAEVEPYRLGDVQFPKRRLIVRDAARLAAAAGEVDTAVELIDGHLAVDPRDIPLALEAAAALEPSSPGSALERRNELFSRWPSVPMVAQAYLEQLSREEREPELLDGTMRFLSYVHRPAESMQGVMKSWRLFWSDNGKFTSAKSYLWETKLKGTRFELQAGLPVGQTHVRLEAPPYSSLELRGATLSLHPKGEVIPMDLDSVQSQVGIDVHELGWSLDSGVVSRLTFQVPDELKGRGCVVLLAGEVTGIPGWLRSVLARGVAQGLAPRYLEAGDERRLDLVRSGWIDYHLLHPVQCTGSVEGDVPYTREGDTLVFGIDLGAQGKGRAGTVDFGLFPGDTLVMAQGALAAPGYEFSFDGVELQGAEARVTHGDARLYWKVVDTDPGRDLPAHILKGYVR